MKRLNAMKQLKRLSINIDETKQLSQMNLKIQNLEVLCVEGNVNSFTLYHRSVMKNLTRLSIEGCTIGFFIGRSILNCKKLKCLRLYSCDIPKKGVVKYLFKKFFERFEYLDLSRSRFNVECLENISIHQESKIKTVIFDRIKGIPIELFQSLFKVSSLDTIVVTLCDLGRDFLKALAASDKKESPYTIGISLVGNNFSFSLIEIELRERNDIKICIMSEMKNAEKRIFKF